MTSAQSGLEVSAPRTYREKLFNLLAGQLLLFEQLGVLRDHHLLQCFGIERIEIR